MLLKNPFRHYPTYSARVVFTDGKVMGRTGEAEAETLYIPGEKENIRVVAVVGRDSANNPGASKMWLDDYWQEYDEELFNQLVQGAPEPELELELEETVEEEVVVQSEVAVEVLRAGSEASPQFNEDIETDEDE
jgi:hypothetical protein